MVERLYISAHSRDLNAIQYDKDGGTILKYDSDYLPLCPHLCYVDDIDMVIDVETGQILNWDADKVREGLMAKKEEMESR